MPKSYFTAFPSDLPPDELTARRQRQRYAEWGLSVATMGGTPPAPAVIENLQAYINGEVQIEDLARMGADDPVPSPAYLATLSRHRLKQH
ncbi:hypothetical protein [Hymenobacter crusticola]|uniref:Antitoxin VbhA domain-containing protein n=1 Tax=Hymenobacter crusticola TaxID=1770526 RepID=A0A243WKM1_9BACT|nr:hypothetical protein [Hymenobacter crusticola]OUJ75887.1 hypothetical protein BXP70_00915 [Hymenobacter crusticola]